jgi:hypothetical protein
VIEENGGRGQAAPTPNELGKRQEEEDITQFNAKSFPAVCPYVLGFCVGLFGLCNKNT